MARVFSGIQPSGELHIGNYLGAVKNWVALQHEFESFICIVDLHAITQPYAPDELRTRTRGMAISLLAAGIEPGEPADIAVPDLEVKPLETEIETKEQS